MGQHIVTNPDTMAGKPVIAGTRITVEAVLRRLAAGESVDGIVAAHPRLKLESVQAALEYAADALGHAVVHDIGGDVRGTR